MHDPPSLRLLPSNSSCSSLDRTTVSSMSLPPTTNDLDDKKKQRLLKQTRKLSQILGELPREAAAQPHLAGCSLPDAEAPSTEASPQLHRQHVRFSRYSFIGSRSPPFRFPLPSYSELEATSDMAPHRRPSIRDAPARSSSTRRPPARRPSHSNQLDLARFGLGRLRGAESAKSNESDENTRLTGHRSDAAEMPARSSSLRALGHVHQTLPRGKLRRRSVHNPVIAASRMPPQKPTGISSSARIQRSVSLWTKRSVTKDESARQQRPTTAQSREDDDASCNEHPPLTEAQRIQRIRRGKKLTKLFGAEPPIALYRIASPSDEGPAPPNIITDERIKTYLALSSNDVPSVYSGCSSSMHRSLSSISSISIAVPSSDSLGYEVDPLEEFESDQTLAVPLLGFDDDLDSVAQDYRLDDSASATFRRRRQRAAKLSRFFGVAFNDLSIPTGTATATATPESDTPREAVQSGEVDVRIQEPGWFWNRAEGGQNTGIERADMNDVITLLRQMPRA